VHSDDRIAKPQSLVTIGLALVLVTVAAPTPAAAYGDGSHASLDPTTAWKRVKANVSSGDVDAARSVFQNHIKPHGDVASAARDAISSGLDDLAAADRDSTNSTVAEQQVDKAHYPLAFANVETAVEAGNASEAATWAHLLEAKFGDAVAEEVHALENASGDAELEAALADLEAAYRDVSLAKAWAEAEETPPLVGNGDLDTAAKEAAEARWYMEGARPLAQEVLGANDTRILFTELDELVGYAQDGEADGAADEVDEIHGYLSRLGLATLPQEKVEAWTEVKSHLGEGDVDAAEEAYRAAFTDEFGEYAQGAHDRIPKALDDARDARTRGDDATYEVHTQLVAKGILDGATRVGLHELDEAEVHEALEYLAIPADKFGWTADEPGDAAKALGAVSASDAAPSDAVDGVRAGLYDAYSAKVLEEADEVAINWNDTATAREKAIEGVAYYHPLEPEVARTLDEERADQLLRDLWSLYNATTAEDRSRADALIENVTSTLEEYRSAGSDASETERALSKVERLLGTIHEEIVEYEEYKAKGKDDQAQVEIEESESFLSQIRSTLADHEDALKSADETAYNDLQSHLDAIDTRLKSGENVSEVKGITEDARSTLDAFRGESGGDVVVRFGDPALGDKAGTVRVPVLLENLPTEGYALQAAVTVDPALAEPVGVEVAAEVGSSTVENGTIRFNAAQPQGAETPAKVATLILRPADVDTVALDVTVEQLADFQGEPLDLREVRGDQVDVAAATEAGSEVPAPGLGLLAAAGLAALALRRRW
jgi:hypothetical protein